MPVGTQGTVKSLTPAHLHEIGAQIILGNTYHLNLRPGSELVRELGGLHRFMGWDGPILTDSGGFQVFSLAKLRDIRDDGVAFQSHLDGAKLFLGPKEVMGIQQNLGSDIAMVLDECPPWPCERDACARAVARSHRWAQQCRQIATDSGFLAAGHHVFAIAQGSTFDDLRREAAEGLAALDFRLGIFGDGFGGVVNIHITKRNDVFRFQIEQIIGPHPADADAGDVQFFARRFFPGTGHEMARDKEKRRGHGGGGDKLAAADQAV